MTLTPQTYPTVIRPSESAQPIPPDQSVGRLPAGRLHGRVYRALLWNADRAALEPPPPHLVDRRV